MKKKTSIYCCPHYYYQDAVQQRYLLQNKSTNLQKIKRKENGICLEMNKIIFFQILLEYLG